MKKEQITALIAVAVMIVIISSRRDILQIFRTEDDNFPDTTLKSLLPLSEYEKGTPLNLTEQQNVQLCLANAKYDMIDARKSFIDVHRRAHSYLTSQSIVIDVGGNIGADAEIILKKFKPKQYMILEPMVKLYKGLVDKFRTNPSVMVYNFGLGKKNQIYNVDLTGSHSEGTSIFKNSNPKSSGSEQLRIVNAKDFFLNVGLGLFEVDLITINCEGCEFELLELITGSTLVNKFKHIQFQPHVRLKGLVEPITRYCRLQQLLSRTHVIDYQYKYIWEMWHRKDIKK